MALVIPAETSNSYERPPEGNHVAVCCSLVDLGTQYSEVYQKSQRKILIEWELSEETKENGEPFYIDQIYTFSMNEKSTLRLALESWRGVKFSPEDFGKFELSNLIGKGCMLNAIHTEKGDKVYANIASIARLPKGMKPPTLQASPRIFSMAPGEYDATAMEGLRERIIDKIKASPEWAALNTGNVAATPLPYSSEQADDIPF